MVGQNWLTFFDWGESQKKKFYLKMEFFIFSKFKFFKFHGQRRALQLVFYILDADLSEELKISLLRLVTRMVLLFSSG